MIAHRYILTSVLTFILAVNAQPPTALRLMPGARADKCLTAASGADGAPVVIRPCTGDPLQLWTFSGGAAMLDNNKCLDAKDGVDADGTKLQIWECVPGSTNQQFYQTNDRTIVWAGRGKCADLTDGRQDDWNVVQVWSCVFGNTNQVWDAATVA